MSQQQGFGTGGGGGTGILTIAGSDTLAVPADAFNNINLLGGGGVTVLGNIGASTLTIYTQDGGATGTGTTDALNPTQDLITLNLGLIPGVYFYTVDIVGFDAATPLGVAYHMTGAGRTTGLASSEIGAQTSDDYEEGALSTCDNDVIFDGAGNNLIVRVTGTPFPVPGKTVSWKASLTYTFRS